ncbi:ABC transporter substrate-binding protein [Acuticoccus sediminis]|uniref:ABC transporter substrate-binding protein n=1 Tax=Acuticoccus sediminis TaxID=2184697 RepID=UPI00139191B0|nr:ABC transporter substrate-binding protein [Acuticoccus sediminis]
MKLTRRRLLESGAAAGAFAMSSAAGIRLTVAQEAEEIRIGTLCPITRAGSVFGPGIQRGIQFAADDINAAGGLLGGRKIRLFNEDTQSDPDSAVRAAKKLIEINETETLLGTWSSGVTMAIAPIAIEGKVVNMNVSGTTDLRTMDKDEWIWPCGGSNIAYGKMMGEYAIAQGYKNASFLAFNNPSGITLGEEFKKVFVDAGGTCEVVVYNPNQPSYRAELTRALASGPEVIALGSYLPDTTILLKEWYAMGEPVDWVGPIWAVSPALIEAVGADAAEGIVSIGAVPNFDSPAFESFKERYESAMDQPILANPFAAIGYDMMITCALAMEAAGSSKAEEFRRQIRAVSSPPGEKVYTVAEALEAVRAGTEIDYEGVGGNMDFDETGEAKPYFAYWKAEGGTLNLKGPIES